MKTLAVLVCVLAASSCISGQDTDATATTNDMTISIEKETGTDSSVTMGPTGLSISLSTDSNNVVSENTNDATQPSEISRGEKTVDRQPIAVAKGGEGEDSENEVDSDSPVTRGRSALSSTSQGEEEEANWNSRFGRSDSYDRYNDRYRDRRGNRFPYYDERGNAPYLSRDRYGGSYRHENDLYRRDYGRDFGRSYGRRGRYNSYGDDLYRGSYPSGNYGGYADYRGQGDYGYGGQLRGYAAAKARYVGPYHGYGY